MMRTTGAAPSTAAKGRPVRAALVAAVAVVALGVPLAVVTLRESSVEATAAEGSPVTTSTVRRETLVRSEKHRGEVGYGAPTSLGFASSEGPGGGHDAGTVTWLPEVGTVVDRGQQLWRTDDKPTVAVFGALPAYRELVVGVRGPDVAQLKENLTALGYGGFSDDDRYTAATSRAVSAWQADVGLPRTGRLGPEQVVVVPGPVRVSSRAVDLGAPAAVRMLSVTDVRRVVTFDLDPSKASAPDLGSAVTVGLADGSTAPGVVSAVGPPVTSGDEGGSPSPGGGTDATTVTVEVTLDEPAVLDGLDASRVDVELDLEERPDVLTVPVTALLALTEGGYGVEVGAQERRLVPVEPGMFASGRVEVTGEVAEGDEVVVPS